MIIISYIFLVIVLCMNFGLDIIHMEEKEPYAGIDMIIHSACMIALAFLGTYVF